MPIQQLQPEFIRPIYSGTWAGKPSAVGNAGKEIILTDMGRSRWYSDGTYWRPVGGMMAFPVNCQGVSSSNPALTAVTVPNMPLLPLKEWLSTPGCSIETRARFHRTSPANTQNMNVILDGATVRMLQTQGANTNQAVYAYGTIANYSATTCIRSISGELITGFIGADLTVALSALTDGLVAPVLSIQPGATDGSETVNLGALCFTLRM